MKNDIHPQVNNVIFEDASTGTRFFATSTLDSEKKDTVDGVEYHVIQVELSSDSHPFFTGKQMLVDTAGQVDKFKQKAAKAADTTRSKAEKKAAQKAKKEAAKQEA